MKRVDRIYFSKRPSTGKVEIGSLWALASSCQWDCEYSVTDTTVYSSGTLAETTLALHTSFCCCCLYISIIIIILKSITVLTDWKQSPNGGLLTPFFKESIAPLFVFAKLP